MLKHRPNFDRLFLALSDQHRRAIIQRLAAGPASVSELAKPLPLSMPGVVQHLAVLESAGLVTSRKEGRVRTCTLQMQALAAAETWIADRRAAMNDRLDRLEQHLRNTK